MLWELCCPFKSQCAPRGLQLVPCYIRERYFVAQSGLRKGVTMKLNGSFNCNTCRSTCQVLMHSSQRPACTVYITRVYFTCNKHWHSRKGHHDQAKDDGRLSSWLDGARYSEKVNQYRSIQQWASIPPPPPFVPHFDFFQLCCLKAQSSLLWYICNRHSLTNASVVDITRTRMGGYHENFC